MSSRRLSVVPVDDSSHPQTRREGGSKKRSSRACDVKYRRRSKCEDIQDAPDGGQSCRLCRQSQQQCLFTLPVRKRGPTPGFRAYQVHNPPADQTPPPSRLDASRDIPTVRSTLHHSRTPSPTSTSLQAPETQARLRRGESLFGIPTAMVDQLLAVYFTHVHNVWPLVHKPFFDPHKTPSHLLFSMLAVASCVAPSLTHEGFDSVVLFAMAERALHHRHMQSGLDIIQSLILLSLRQTGCGDKRSAALYAGRACIMALTMGLNLALSFQAGETTRVSCSFLSDVDSETRARVYWNCYVLDKTIAEETGRPFLLPYRRASIPFPSINETDELETWPPLPMSSSPLPKSVRHIIPRRGYVLSCFVWTCRLAMVVEDILDLEVEGPARDGSPWDRDFGTWSRDRRDKTIDVQGVSNMLDSWMAQLPRSLHVDIEGKFSPLPHHVVSLTWYHTARILLYSRSLRQQCTPQPLLVPSQLLDTSPISHAVCSEAAQSVVDLLGHLDRHRLLQQVSSDIIHLLSLATLFEAYDSMSGNRDLANRAKFNFSRCCLWLREFSSSWPAASAHRMFFEGLIRGGLQLSSPEDGSSNNPNHTSVLSTTSEMESQAPPIPDGLRAVGRHLSVSDPTASQPNIVETQSTTALSHLFQLPQFYWNQLTNPPVDLSTPESYAPSNFAFQPSTGPEVGVVLSQHTTSNGTITSKLTNSSLGQGDKITSSAIAPEMAFWEQSMGEVASSSFLSSGPGAMSQAHTPGPEVDQSAIYEALMSYMMDAARGS
ncbi:fungal-specific transcription factor domain-domain-containing protein [Naematelia encephala]|uniref:Fungal-specific transcription factor domain-domain-containing protein n=1 Tax=Naematelia encephala TaxID=71784 RepID=A0A1Y2AEV5_9TREE|nr:fungal-specific transcription factor domain-domain-containing protein [Naematelia encephala]